MRKSSLSFESARTRRTLPVSSCLDTRLRSVCPCDVAAAPGKRAGARLHLCRLRCGLERGSCSKRLCRGCKRVHSPRHSHLSHLQHSRRQLTSRYGSALRACIPCQWLPMTPALRDIQTFPRIRKAIIRSTVSASSRSLLPAVEPYAVVEHSLRQQCTGCSNTVVYLFLHG